MIREVIQYVIIFILAIAMQVLIFNNIVLFNVALPIVFIYFIIRLPIQLSTNWVLTISFILGLIIDIFSNTLGIHTLSCTILAMIRRPIFTLYNPREKESANVAPSIATLGLFVYIKYLITITLAYCVLVFCIEYLSLEHLKIMLLKISSSAILSFTLMLGIDSLISRKS